MATRVIQTVPAKLLRQSGNGDYQPCVELSAERFMGVLKHPVPRGEMLKRFGVDRPGCKIQARWCDDVPDRDPVQPGDLLEIEGRHHPIIGAKSYPGCYIEFFIDQH